jgi:hypothetical protein
MNADKQKRLIVLAALDRLGGIATKAETLDFAAQQRLIAITPERERNIWIHGRSLGGGTL